MKLKNIKIVFIQPPFEKEYCVGKNQSIKSILNLIPPLGIAYIAALLEKYSYNVKIFDCTVGLSQSTLIKLVTEESPDIIGISCTTPSFDSALKIANALKSVLPEGIIVIGGSHVSADPFGTMKFKCWDLGVIGEGELTFLELVQTIAQGTYHKEFKNINGLVYREDGEIKFTSHREFIKDLDSIPFPARHLLPPLKAYSPTPASYRKLPIGVLITSRGCPHLCTFCDRAVFGNSYRARSPANVVDEVEELIKRYGAREIRFFDDTFTLKEKRVTEICEEIQRRNLKIPWTCLTTVTSVTEPMLRAMKSAGCWQVLYGLESGDPEMLKKLKKGNTLEVNEQAVRLAQKIGLSIRADFIIGTPGETRESLKRTLDFAKRMKVDYAHFNKFVPFPGTEIYEELKGKGYNFDFTRSSILDNSALLYVPESMTRDELKQFLDYSLKEFYLRPSYIFKKLFRMKSKEELLGQIKGLWAISRL